MRELILHTAEIDNKYYKSLRKNNIDLFEIDKNIKTFIINKKNKPNIYYIDNNEILLKRYDELKNNLDINTLETITINYKIMGNLIIVDLNNDKIKVLNNIKTTDKRKEMIDLIIINYFNEEIENEFEDYKLQILENKLIYTLI